MADYFRANKMEYNPVVFEKIEEANAAYDSGRCDAYTTDQSSLYGVRLALANPDDHVILPEIISKEPFGLTVRQGDSSGQTSFAGRIMRCSTPRNTALRRPMSKR